MTPASTVSLRDEDPQIFDVWSRTATRYRRRAILMLFLLALLFAGLCCFKFWLQTGVYWPWRCDEYRTLMRNSFTPTGTAQVTLSDFLTYPISVKDVPAHGMTMGLLFASLSSIPILVAILYRFPCSIIFAAMVVFLAAMPWLGITILGGCAVTAIRPFKLSFRYATALLGLVPVAVYFVMASWRPAGSAPPDIQHTALLYAPWFLALLGSCVICAVALGLARIINYRPGGIPPVLAVLFAVPVLIFHTQVGRDELEYHILAHNVGPGGEMFRSVDIKSIADQNATHKWSVKRDASYDDIRQEARTEAIREALTRIESERVMATRLCNSFLERFPTSRYVPSVLYLKGRALDQRLRGSQLEYRAECHTEVPSPKSRRTWATLADRFSNETDVTSEAMYRLAVFAIRDGELDTALNLLRRARTLIDDSRSPAGPESDSSAEKDASRGSVFGKAPASSRLGIDTAVTAMYVRRLEEMVRACQNDGRRPLTDVLQVQASGDVIHPLQLLLSLDHGDPRYKAHLAGIAAAFPESETTGYISNRQAHLIPSMMKQISRYRGIATEYDGRPAAAEALFHLATACQEESILDEAKATLEELVRRYPESCWSDQARRSLASLTMLDLGSE
ncbi:MAG: tetratricopeptide repeat protein [Planctomycetota bacterium]|nr:tetratricopeptide repeat protein [Planctomycetota bacterium]